MSALDPVGEVGMSDDTKEAVRQRYAALAVTAAEGGSCCAPDEQEVFGASLYASEDLGVLPEAAAAASFGCGNPITGECGREAEHLSRSHPLDERCRAESRPGSR
jgi:arsenite methyltransferase